MLNYFRNRSRRLKFIEQSKVETVGIAYLTEGFSGTRINLTKELRLNGHPIGLILGHKFETGRLYNQHGFKYLDSKKLIKRYVFSLSDVPESLDQMPAYERQPYCRFEKGSLMELRDNNRRALRVIDLEWEDDDWSWPGAMLVEKYPKLLQLIFDVTLVSELSGELGIVNDSIPSGQAFSVCRATAVSANEKIGTISKGLFVLIKGKWVARNEFEQSAELSTREMAVNWVAITSLGGVNNTRNLLEKKQYLEYHV